MGTRFRTTLGILAAGFLVARPAAADPWTVEQVVEKALAHSPALKARQAAQDKARYERHASLADLGPRLNL